MELENQYENNTEYKALWQCLTDKEQKFVEAYLATSNAIEAAVRAGYSEKSARASGYQILNKQKVQDVIFYRQNGVAKKFKLETKEDAKEFLVELIQTTFTAKKFTTSLQALQLLGEWYGFNAPIKSEQLKQEIRVNFSGNNSQKKKFTPDSTSRISELTKSIGANSPIEDIDFSNLSQAEPLPKEQPETDPEDTDI